METVGYVLAIVAGLIHTVIFYLESIAWGRPSVHRQFGVREERDVRTLTQVMFNQGFYNLFLAFGAIGGAILGLGGSTVGRGLSLYAVTFMAGAALVLIGSNSRMVRGALIQGVIPAAALVALLLG